MFVRRAYPTGGGHSGPSSSDLVSGGIYTIPEAASLVAASERRLRGWVSGYEGSKAAPIIDNELGWLDRRLALSFTNLMELRFIAFFVNAGIPLARIRAIMNEVRHELHHPHPFATKTVFRTDGKKIVADIALRNGVKKIYDLATKNYEMRTVVLKTLKEDVIYDVAGTARAWFPRKRIAPNVIVHPKFAFGRPVLRESMIPTAALADAVQAEGTIKGAAAIFDVPERQVREAVKFEASLRHAA